MVQPIVDSHVHFWDPAHLHYPWLASVPQINKVHLLPAYRDATAGLDVRQMVFVQCDCIAEEGLAEAQWVTTLAQDDRRIRAIVAFAALEMGEGVRPALAELRGLPLVKGVRRLIQSEGPGFAVQPGFIQGVQMLAEYGFSFDICIRHHQMADAVRLVKQCPQVSFILDHIGKPDIKGQLFQPWRQEIRSLAQLPNVICKVSGLVTEADMDNWSRTDLRPYIDHVLEVFGVDRVAYGGDWPVSTQASTYRGWLETLQWATEGFSSTEAHKLFYQNAYDFYRLTA